MRPTFRALLLFAAALQACATENVTEVVVVSVAVRPDNAAIAEGDSLQFEAVVGDEAGGAQTGAPVVWSSDTPEVVFVDQTGVARALSTGVANVEATYRGMTGSATVSVLPGPTLVVDPAVVSIFGDVLGDTFSVETVRISNGGVGRLTGLASAVRYESGGTEGWLTADLSGDATPATLTLTHDAEALPAGVYDAVVVVTSAEGSDLSTSLPVRLSLAGVTLQETLGGTSVEESGSTDTFSVVLDIAPGADVQLSVTSEDAIQVDVSPSSLTFTPSNWSTPQTVTVAAVDDPVVNGDRTVEVAVSVAEAGDTPYRVVNTRAIEVTVVDDDVAGFLLTETGTWTSAREGGYTDTISVVLTTKPLTAVVFSVATDDPDDATVDPDRLTFTPLDWDEPQIVIFTAVDDLLRDGYGFRTLTFAVDPSASDAAFHGLSRTIDAVTFDNDWFRGSAPGPGH